MPDEATRNQPLYECSVSQLIIHRSYYFFKLFVAGAADTHRCYAPSLLLLLLRTLSGIVHRLTGGRRQIAASLACYEPSLLALALFTLG